MGERSRRNVKRVDYRRLHIIGFDEDSSEDDCSMSSDDDEELMDNESVDGEDGEPIEPNQEDEEESGDEEEEEGPDDQFEEDMLMGGGVEWTETASDVPFPGWRNRIRNYDDGPRGDAKAPGNQDRTKSDIFRLFFDDALLNEICMWTNYFAQYCVDKFNERHPERDPRIWKELEPVELRGFLGLLLLAGVEKGRKQPWSELWSKQEKIRRPAFAATMSRTRFFNIMNFLRFDDAVSRHRRREENPGQATTRDDDRMGPFKEIFQLINNKFDVLYEPGAKLCVDEQIVRFRGRSSFRVYMPDKPGKYGLKIWALVDNASGYILKLQVYTGQQQGHPEVGQGKRVVLDLVSKYERTERGVVADNFFSSMDLVRELLTRELTFCGTIRKNRREIPQVMRNISGADTGNYFLFNEDHLVTLVRHIPRRNKYVLLISSAHYADDVVEIRGKLKPVIIDYYNSNKCGVDTADQMLQTYTSQFPTKRWPMKLFIHMLDCSALNSYVIWLRNDPGWKENTKSRRRFFIRELAYELVLPQIRSRASKVPNLHKYVQTAMGALGVVYRPGGRQPQVGAEPRAFRRGRCRFDGHIKYTNRSCCKCAVAICQDHWDYVCPICKEQVAPVPAV